MNMEQMPSGPESVDRNVLVEALKARGIEDEVTREMLVAWTTEAEERAMAEGTRKAQIEFELDRAALYEDAGMKDAARETLTDLINVVLTNEPASEEFEDLRAKAEYRLSQLG